MAKLYVYQDGADFYLHSRPEMTAETFIRTETAPFKVGDFDLDAARKAREWFEEWGYLKGGPEGDEVVWVEEYEHSEVRGFPR